MPGVVLKGLQTLFVAIALLICTALVWQWLVNPEPIGFATAIGLLPAILAAWAVTRDWADKDRVLIGPPTSAAHEVLSPDAQGVAVDRSHSVVRRLFVGLYGGLVAGCVVGVAHSLIYYFTTRDELRWLDPSGLTYDERYVAVSGTWVIPMVFLFSTLAGSAIGGASLLGAAVARRWAMGRDHLALVANELTGAVVFGMPVAIGVAVLYTLTYGGYLRPGPFNNLITVVTVFPLVAIALVGAILYFDTGGRWRLIWPSVLASLLACIIISAIGYLVWSWANTPSYFDEDPASGALPTTATMALGGAIDGAIGGFILSTQIGVSLAWRRAWPRVARWLNVAV